MAAVLGSNNAAAIEALCAAGAVKATVKATKALAQDPGACIEAFRLLATLAATVPGAVKAVSAGAVELAVRAIAAEGGGDAEAGVADEAMRFLINVVVV